VLLKETHAMTAPSSIDPAQFLHEQLASASPDLQRSLLSAFINTLMSAEAEPCAALPTASRARSGPTGEHPGAGVAAPFWPSGLPLGAGLLLSWPVLRRGRVLRKRMVTGKRG
jgi:hypothetical protein